MGTAQADDLAAERRSSGLVCAWDAADARLYCGGDTRRLRAWDLDAEVASHSVETGSDACVTALALPPGRPQVVAAGFGDGTLRLFDLRQRRAAQAYPSAERNARFG